MKARLAGAVLAAALFVPAAQAQTPYAPTETAYVPSEAPPSGGSVCPGGLCQVGALDGVFEALAATEAGRRERPVHILQLGDSHTAGDRITGAVRAALQTRFGNAGRGVVPPGVPYDGYAPYQVQMAGAGWVRDSAPLQPVGGQPSLAVGLAGMRGQAMAGTDLTLTLEPGAEARVVGLCGLSRPAGGLEVRTEAVVVPVDLAVPSGAAGPVCVDVALAEAARPVTVRGTGAGATLDSVRLQRSNPGVMVSNLGVVGATLRDLARRDEAIVATELAVWRPQLIVLAYGVNEGFDPALDPVTYEALLRGQIDRLRRLAPAASLLILGAPDAQRNGVSDGCSADGLRAPPPMLAVVRDVQRRVAADMGVAFWDWHGRMGGDCAADRLALRAEPYMRGDRVHFTSAGADWIGGVLAEDLLAAYAAWKAGPGGAA